MGMDTKMARVEVAFEIAKVRVALVDIGAEATAWIASITNIETVTKGDIGDTP